MTRDFDLKLRIRRVLWAQGYHCPLEVDLSHFEYQGGRRVPKRVSLTDIDVLGVRFEPDLRFSVVLADCKSGRVSEPNRVFWLRGVMDFFGAREGYLVKPTLHKHARHLAPKLGIRALDETGLSTLEKALATPALPRVIAHESAVRKGAQLWAGLFTRGEKTTKEELAVKEAGDYLQYRYWMVEEYRNTQTILDQMKRIGPTLDPQNDGNKYLAHIALQRLLLSFLRMASEVVSRDATNVKDGCRMYLFGGPLLLHARYEMMQLLTAIEAQGRLLPDEIRLEPPYFEDLCEIVHRMILNSANAVRALQHLDIITAAAVTAVPPDLESSLGTAFSADALVLIKRVAALLCQAASLHRRLVEPLWDL